MKKLINDPANVVREALQGMEAAHSDLIKVTYDPYTIVREGRAGSGQGGARIRRWLGARAHARRVRGHGHARRRVSG